MIDIRSVTNSPAERTIDNLKRVYLDTPFLLKLVNEMLESLDYKFSGQRVLLKPNLVSHNKLSSDMFCLRTHDNFILATLEAVLQKRPERVLLGDAPVQGCDWQKIFSKDFLNKINDLGKKYNIEVVVKDFRKRFFTYTGSSRFKEINPDSEFVTFDLGENSFLEEISIESKNIFRVTDYAADKLGEYHKRGTHKYCIAKDVFDSDVIISLSKAKTHQKTGITNSMKNLVGLNGDKACLPHHRVGGVKNGGDCYSGGNPIIKLAEKILELANKNQDNSYYNLLRLLAFRIWRLSFPSKAQNLNAGWYGNDTTWRMVLDINRIAEFGKMDGSINVKPQRSLISITDGIIGGQGNGPLSPDPLPLGIVSVSDCLAALDMAICILMGFDINRIPIVRASCKDLDLKSIKMSFNGKIVEFNDLSDYSIKTIPPPGWQGYL